MRVEERFWAKVDKSGECWIRNASFDSDGYGRFVSKILKVRVAHRASYLLTHGSIPDGMQVLHRCDNPPCVRPEHLFLGTNADNVADMVSKGRFKGKVLSESQVVEIVALHGKRAVSRRELAKRYGVTEWTISQIIKGKSWKSVTAQESEQLVA